MDGSSDALSDVELSRAEQHGNAVDASWVYHTAHQRSPLTQVLLQVADLSLRDLQLQGGAAGTAC